MVERLYFADLVLADMTIPNGNVYYEVGVRHAAKRTGCVLLAADWSKQLFDVAQMRTVRYPLKEGNIEGATARAVSEAIKGPIDTLSRGDSPVFGSIKGYPTNPDPAAASTMNDVMAQTAVLQGKIRAVRAYPKSDRMAEAQALAEQSINARTGPSDAIALIRLLRDCVDSKEDWAWLADFIEKAPSDIANLEDDDKSQSRACLARPCAPGRERVPKSSLQCGVALIPVSARQYCRPIDDRNAGRGEIFAPPIEERLTVRSNPSIHDSGVGILSRIIWHGGN